MSQVYLLQAAKSHYCKVVFLVTLIGSYFLIPAHVFGGIYTGVAILFMLTFSTLITCFVRETKEKIKSKREHGVSFLGILASILGFSAFQFCGIGAPICGASLGVAFLSSVLPSFFVGMLTAYSDLILVVAIGVQIAALVYMNCFRKVATQIS